MDTYGDVQSTKLTAVGQSVSGRRRLHGFQLVPIYSITSSYLHTEAFIFGTIRLRDGSVTGTIRVEFPVVATVGYAQVTSMGLADDDGYVLFDDGIYIDETERTGGSGRESAIGDGNFELIVFYS